MHFLKLQILQFGQDQANINYLSVSLVYHQKQRSVYISLLYHLNSLCKVELNTVQTPDSYSSNENNQNESETISISSPNNFTKYLEMGMQVFFYLDCEGKKKSSDWDSPRCSKKPIGFSIYSFSSSHSDQWVITGQMLLIPVTMPVQYLIRNIVGCMLLCFYDVISKDTEATYRGNTETVYFISSWNEMWKYLLKM